MARLGQGIRRASSAVALVALLVLLVLALPASARPAPASDGPSTSSCATTPPAGWVQLPGHLPPLLAYAQLLRPASFTHALTLSIAFFPRNPDALAQLLHNIADPASPDYQHYLTPVQFDARFSPPPAAIAQVRAFLLGAHLQVGNLTGFIMQASGSLAEVQCAFAVQINEYQLGSRVVYAPASNPSVPAAIAPYLQAIIGLDNVATMQHDPILNP
jgi:kumamolisin